MKSPRKEIVRRHRHLCPSNPVRGSSSEKNSTSKASYKCYTPWSKTQKLIYTWIRKVRWEENDFKRRISLKMQGRKIKLVWVWQFQSKVFRASGDRETRYPLAIRNQSKEMISTVFKRGSQSERSLVFQKYFPIQNSPTSERIEVFSFSKLLLQNTFLFFLQCLLRYLTKESYNILASIFIKVSCSKILKYPWLNIKMHAPSSWIFSYFEFVLFG